LFGRFHAAALFLLTLTIALPCAAREDDMPGPDDSAYMERATSMLQQAVEAGDQLATASAQLALAEHMYSRGLWAEAAAHAELGRAAARLAGDQTLVPELEHFMARALLRLERSAEATEIYLSLLGRAESSGNTELAAKANLSLSSLQGRAGDLQAAKSFARSALQLTDAMDNADLRARVLINLAQIAYMEGRSEAASEFIAEAGSLAAKELSDQTRSSLLMAELGIEARDGNVERLLPIAENALSVAERVDSLFFRAFALSRLGPLLCRAGRSGEAIERFEQAAALFERSDAPIEQSETLAALAQCLTQNQRHEEAYDRLVESRSLLQEAHGRQRSESMQAGLAAFQSERQLRELARLVEEEQQLQTRVSRQQLRISLMVIGILLLGGLVGVLWLRNRRIAEQRAAQLKLEQTRIDLLARTSHEIRNPVQGLIGLLEARSTEQQRVQDPDQQSALAAARMIQYLANDYLDLSLLEQGKLRICYEAHCRLAELVEHVGQLARSFLDKAMPRLNISIASDLPEWIHADTDRLMQILLNLVVNAARYGGDQDIDLSLDRSADDDSLLIRVEDRGPGLGDAGEHLFDPYVRGDTGAENSRGTGLGLSISARIVEAMGGRMQATNRKEGGARFEVRLPLRAADAPLEVESGERTESHDSPSRRRRVLVVDDDLFARTGIRAVLDSFGCETFEAADWSEMKSIIDQQDPSLILLDRHLLREDGLALANRLRERDRRRSRQRRRIVMISGSERPSDTDNEQLDDWIIKPVTRARIAPLLDSAPTR
jgi:signal transduction histidine kinase